MYQGQTVFSQLMDFLPRHSFRQCVTRYQGNYRMRSFSCYDQFLCMAFAQLTFRESLRDIECCLGALEEKLYHAGFRGHVSRSTLADANKNRDWRISRRFCPTAHSSSPHALPQRRFRSPAQRNRLCSGFQHYRSVPVVIPLGAVPENQSRH